jgi:hypothetical protein
MAGVAFAVEGDGVGFATESYAASALYATLASLSGALWRIRQAKAKKRVVAMVQAVFSIDEIKTRSRKNIQEAFAVPRLSADERRHAMLGEHLVVLLGQRVDGY